MSLECCPDCVSCSGQCAQCGRELATMPLPPTVVDCIRALEKIAERSPRKTVRDPRAWARKIAGSALADFIAAGRPGVPAKKLCNSGHDLRSAWIAAGRPGLPEEEEK